MHVILELLKTVSKVLAFVVRGKNGARELLVFEQSAKPEAGRQVPAGTVADGEPLAVALARELVEESGLRLGEPPRYLGAFPYFHPKKKRDQIRNIFVIDSKSDLPDSWSHTVTGGGKDRGLIFKYSWIKLSDAKKLLAASQGDYADAI